MKNRFEKSIIAGILASTMVISSISISFAGTKNKMFFPDITSHWAKSIIENYTSLGIIKGMEDGLFKPDFKITRAQFFTIIHMSLDIKINYFAAPDITKTFSDVHNEDWYAGVVNDLCTSGIIDDKNKLRPNDAITREEMAHYVVNAYVKTRGDGFTRGDVSRIGILDSAKVDKKYAEDVYLAYSLKLLKGKPGGLFEPKMNATRAEGIVVVNNLLSALGYNNLEPISFEPSYTNDANGITMKLTINNKSSKDIRITHTSGQKYDFELLDSNKNPIYKWSDGMMFTQAIENSLIQKAGKLEFSEALQYKGNEGVIANASYLVCYLKGTIEGNEVNSAGYMIYIVKTPENTSNLNGGRQIVSRDENRFKIVKDDKALYLKDWDAIVDIKGIFGEPIAEKIEVLGPGSDTFTGAFVKKMFFDGLEVELMSPKGNGKTFSVSKIQVKSAQYSTGSGIKVGDSLEKLLSDKDLKKISIVPDNRTDKNNCAYVVRNETESICMQFEVINGKVKEITLLYELN